MLTPKPHITTCICAVHRRYGTHTIASQTRKVTADLKLPELLLTSSWRRGYTGVLTTLHVRPFDLQWPLYNLMSANQIRNCRHRWGQRREGGKNLCSVPGLALILSFNGARMHLEADWPVHRGPITQCQSRAEFTYLLAFYRIALTSIIQILPC
jgi:hypothetical protein